LPVVIYYEGYSILWDGNHRAAAAYFDDYKTLKVRSFSLDAFGNMDAYDPDEERDEHGRWASNGGYDLTDPVDHELLLASTLSHPMSDDEEKALEDYTHNGYLATNQALRNGLDTDTHHLDNVFHRANLPVDMQVYRQVDKKTFDEIKASGVYHDKAFISATARRDLLPKNNVVTLRLPAGSKAIPLGSLSSHEATESEVLIARNQTFHVVPGKHDNLILKLH
jgi:hypothetical protein